MEKEFVPYNIALRMKALGFDEPCIASFIYGANGPLLQFPGSQNSIDWEDCRNCSTPTYQSAFKWFRDNYGLVPDFEYYGEWNYEILRIDEIMCELQDDLNLDYTFMGGSYEEAELACLKKLVETIEERTKII